jgi:hypothetical protein
MARVLKELPQASRPDGKYKWSEWTNGQVWFLVSGTDYTSSNTAMRQTIQGAAKRRNLEVTIVTHVDGKDSGLAIQFSPPNGTQRRSGGARTRAK